MNKKIDWTQPLELDDGTPVELVEGPGVDGDYYVRTPKYRRGFNTNRMEGWYYEAGGVYRGGNAATYYTIRNVQPKAPDAPAPAPKYDLALTYGVDYRINRSGFVLVRNDGEWVTLGETRSRLFLGIITLLVEAQEEVIAGRAPEALRAVAEITTRALLRELSATPFSVKQETMASLFETLQVLLASLGDPEGKTEWKRAA